MYSTSRNSQSGKGDNDVNINNHSKKKTIEKTIEEAETGCLSICKGSWCTVTWDIRKSPVSTVGVKVLCHPYPFPGSSRMHLPWMSTPQCQISWVTSSFKTCPFVWSQHEEGPTDLDEMTVLVRIGLHVLKVIHSSNSMHICWAWNGFLRKQIQYIGLQGIGKCIMSSLSPPPSLAPAWPLGDLVSG